MTKEFDKFVELGMKALNENLVKAPTPEFVFEEYASEPKEEEVVNEDVVKEDDEEYFTDEEILEFAQMEEDELYEFLQEASEGDEEILESLTDLFVDEVFGYEVEELSESVEEARSFSSQLKLNRAKQKFDKQGFGQKTRRISLTGMGKDKTSGKKAIRKPVVKKNTDKIDPTTQVAPKKASEKGKVHRIGGKFANKQKAQADQAASAKQFGAEKGEADKAAARGKREGRRRARRAKANWKAKKKENSFFNRVKRGYKAFKGESIEAFEFALNESREGAVTVLVECEESEYTFDIPESYAEEVMDLLESIDDMDEDILELVLEYVWMDDTEEINDLFESYNDIEDILESFKDEEDFEEFVESLDDEEFEIFEEAVDDYFENDIFEGSLGRKRGERLRKAANKAWDKSEEAYDSAHGPESTQASRNNYQNKYDKAVKKSDRWKNQLLKSVSKDQNSRDDAKMTPLARRKAKLAGLKAKRQKKG